MDRKTKKTILASGTLLFLVATTAGCQNGMGTYPFFNPSRVPPPPTGSYQLPPDYYSNPNVPATTSSYAPSDNVRFTGGAIDSAGVVPASGSTDSFQDPVQPAAAFNSAERNWRTPR